MFSLLMKLLCIRSVNEKVRLERKFVPGKRSFNEDSRILKKLTCHKGWLQHLYPQKSQPYFKYLALGEPGLFRRKVDRELQGISSGFLQLQTALLLFLFLLPSFLLSPHFASSIISHQLYIENLCYAVGDLVHEKYRILSLESNKYK